MLKSKELTHTDLHQQKTLLWIPCHQAVNATCVIVLKKILPNVMSMDFWIFHHVLMCLSVHQLLSSSHFYGVSDSVKSKFDGLKEINKDNENNFRTLVDIEPVSESYF